MEITAINYAAKNISLIFSPGNFSQNLGQVALLPVNDEISFSGKVIDKFTSNSIPNAEVSLKINLYNTNYSSNNIFLGYTNS